VVADIPGLIEGSSKGAGLGLAFLRHVERTRLLIHIIDISENPYRNPMDNFNALNRELKAYHPSLCEKPQIVTLNKIDIPSVRERVVEIKEQFERIGYRIYPISGKTGEGVDELIKSLSERLKDFGI